MNDDTDRCPATNRNGEQCGHPAGWGTDNDSGPCKHHGGAADNAGENNGNYKHGAYSEVEDFIANDATDEEQAFLDTLDLDEDGEQFVRDVVKEAFIKYKRTGDERFLREVRQWLSEFNIVENGDEVELSGDLSVETGLDEETDRRVGEMVDALTDE